MKIPDPVFVGYFPKRVVHKPDWLHNTSVKRICSVSSCISEAPPDWIQKWKHNKMGFYNSEETALSVLPEDEEGYTLFAFKVYPLRFDSGETSEVDIPPAESADIPEDYEFLGYDASNKTYDNFECSPLSCNSGAEDFEVNSDCLLDDLDRAAEVCTIFSKGSYEPGPYYLVEVYEKRKNC